MPHIVHRHHRRTYKLFCSSLVVGLSGAGKNEAMKRILLWVLALAVIPVGVDAQGTAVASCADISPSSALEDVRTCAEQGDAGAQYNLGYMYTRGGDLPEDIVFAYMWWNLAAAQGDEVAQENKDIIEQQMTRAQIAEAQRLSREWLEAHPPGGN